MEDKILFNELKLLKKKLNKKIKFFNKKLKPLELKILNKENELKKVCSHPKVKKNYEYISGNYYDTGTHVTWWTCKLCGEEISRTEENGGFG